MLANPGVSPRALRVGQTLSIPAGGAPPVAGTPPPLELRGPWCYDTSPRVCAAEVANPGPAGAAFVQVRFEAQSPSGETWAELGDVDLTYIPAGEAVPVAILWPEERPWPQRVVLARAYPWTAPDVGVRVQPITDLAWAGQNRSGEPVQVRVQLSQAEGLGDALLVVAGYDRQGRVIALATQRAEAGQRELVLVLIPWTDATMHRVRAWVEWTRPTSHASPNARDTNRVS